jgi:hypothetical protein
MKRTIGIGPGNADENPLAHTQCLKKGRRTGLEKGQYPFTFLFFIVGIPLLQAALDAITPGLTLIILDAVLFVDSQIAVGVGDGITALITFYLA